jgi:CTP synthase
MAKHIFVMGGVLSSLGKGIACASIGFLLKRMGYTVVMQKFDPYLNLEPGRLSPFQHGEIFVTEDGGEADLDLGHYERFIGESTSKFYNATSGVIYERVIQKERRGEYMGKTVQVIPHVTDEIKMLINTASKDKDIVITEIGGTVGDIESLPFLEAIRQYRLDVGFSNSLFILLTYLPYIQCAGELKTKPTQHATIKLREIGIQPDIILCRTELPLDEENASKIALFTNVPKTHVKQALDAKCVYEVPKNFYNEGVHDIICNHFGIDIKPVDFTIWDEYLHNQENPTGEVNIAICGKYVEHFDAYKSVEEALKHAAVWHKAKLKFRYIDPNKIDSFEEYEELFEGINGILVPGGFGGRSIDGQINVVRYARINKIPFLGIGLGMQVAVIEFAKNVCNIDEAYSTEFREDCTEPVINDLSNEPKLMSHFSGCTRVGAYQCKLQSGSHIQQIYGEEIISERHRTRYMINNRYRNILTENGMKLTGSSHDDASIDVIEITEHPFFIGVQFHPEFKSRPDAPQKLFAAFIQASMRDNE